LHALAQTIPPETMVPAQRDDSRDRAALLVPGRSQPSVQKPTAPYEG